ncbi:hypothetical protein ACFFRR_008710 [Megaselia abdita]
MLKPVILFALILVVLGTVRTATLQDFETNVLSFGRQLNGCPLCDSSVFSYCDYRMFHDSCCCRSNYGPQVPFRPGCQYEDCRSLFAKSCYEHNLIRQCCCENPYQ